MRQKGLKALPHKGLRIYLPNRRFERTLPSECYQTSPLNHANKKVHGMSTANNRRPAFPYRPWITGQLYENLSRAGVLHCDAFVMAQGSHEYLVLSWRERGRILRALDGWLIEPDGLTPIWSPEFIRGVPRHWTRANNATMRRVHARVILLAQDARGTGHWVHVSLQCHYVMARDTDCEIKVNKYRERAPYTPRKKPLALLDVL